MKFLDALLETDSAHAASLSRRSVFSLHSPFLVMLCLLTIIPNISQGQRTQLEESTAQPVSIAAQIKPQKQLSRYQNKEAYLQLWMQFELLRPRIRPPGRQAPIPELNDLRTHVDQNNQEFLVF